MAECVAITRAGYGSLWHFPSVTEAKRHPLVQYGDPVIACMDDIFHEYCVLEYDKFLSRILPQDFNQRVRTRIEELKLQPNMVSRLVVHHVKQEFGEDIWSALLLAAHPVPSDPDEVIDLVQSDRDAIIKERSMAKAASAPAPAAAAPAKEAKEKKPQLIRGHAMTATVTFGTDKEGKSYGPKNNPKREGSASAARFALYKPGKSLADQVKIDGGPTLDDLKFDSDPKRNLIVITD